MSRNQSIALAVIALIVWALWRPSLARHPREIEPAGNSLDPFSNDVDGDGVPEVLF